MTDVIKFSVIPESELLWKCIGDLHEDGKYLSVNCQGYDQKDMKMYDQFQVNAYINEAILIGPQFPNTFTAIHV